MLNRRWLESIAVSSAFIFQIALSGCQPNPSAAPPGVRFMGLADDQQKLIGEESPESALAKLPSVTTVEVRPYREYEETSKAGKIVKEERHGPWVYWAIQDWRDAPFPGGASAMYVFTQRCRSLVPAAAAGPVRSIGR